MFRYLAGALVTVLLAGFLGAALIRFGPGYEMDDRLLDPRYSTESANAITQQNARGPNLAVFYAGYLEKAVHGDFGLSRSFSVPVAELIRSRASVTVRLLAEGLLAGWLLGLSLAAASSLLPPSPGSAAWNLAAESLSALALSLPAAVFALAVYLARGPVFLVLAFAIFPRVFRYARDLFFEARRGSALEAARARGIAGFTLFRDYLVRRSLAPLLALAGVSFSIAFGALIPVEAVCDLPGIGQLAWKAALSRDLPVLVTLTLIVTAITVLLNGLVEAARQLTPAARAAQKNS